MNVNIKHLPHYFALFGLLIAGFAGLVLFSYDKNYQIAVALATAAGYVIWGIVHHSIHKDLYPEVILEYLAVAFLGVVMIFTLILR